MTSIQWYPGHMAKARRQVEEKLSEIDIIYEILDARAPLSSANPMLQEIIGNKPRLVVLNKSDLADPLATAMFLSHFEKTGIPAVAINSLEGSFPKEILQKTDVILKDIRDREKRKGMSPRAYRAMVVGIPNVGKSQFINRLAGKAKAKTGNRPGITKQQTYLKAGKFLELLDNPGILWPKFADRNTGYNLALLGSVKEEVFVSESVAAYGIDLLERLYPGILENRYGVQVDSKEPNQAIDLIGSSRGCLLPEGKIDRDRAAKLFLRDIQTGKLGKISVERPE